MYIKKIKLHNFKRFCNLTIEFNKERNILIGDNESGKSTILQAIDLVARGGRHRVEELGIETLFNTKTILDFMSGERKMDNLPEMWVELYLGGIILEELDGKNNSDNIQAYGLRMLVVPDMALSLDIKNILESKEAAFPFEFYSIQFKTFADQSYNGYTKKLKTIFLDNSVIGSEYALNEYVSSIYSSALSVLDRQKAKHQYGTVKKTFKQEVLKAFDAYLDEGYSFSVKNAGKNSLETDLTIEKDGVPITDKGMGVQCMIKTQLALRRAGENIPVIMIEEPENHLSHLNMRRLLKEIERGSQGQLFIATHSDLICTRLNLKNCILMNSMAGSVTKLDFVSDGTASFFMKAPDNNLLQFVLANKVILVEGDAEFILMEAFYQKEFGKTLDDSGIDVISVDGKCFKRYLELARQMGIKVVVVTDNDRDYAKHITSAYKEYVNGQYANIRVSSDTNNSRWTFEVAVYEDNKTECDDLFSKGLRASSVQEYMLANKADAAFQLLSHKKEQLKTPQYIKDALVWLNS